MLETAGAGTALAGEGKLPQGEGDGAEPSMMKRNSYSWRNSVPGREHGRGKGPGAGASMAGPGKVPGAGP